RNFGDHDLEILSGHGRSLQQVPTDRLRGIRARDMNVAIGGSVSDESRATEARLVAGTDQPWHVLRLHGLVGYPAQADDAVRAHLQVPRDLGEFHAERVLGILRNLVHPEL